MRLRRTGALHRRAVHEMSGFNAEVLRCTVATALAMRGFAPMVGRSRMATASSSPRVWARPALPIWPCTGAALPDWRTRGFNLSAC